PAALQTVIAQTADGMIMGVQHVRRPQWGLQFHPESVCTAHGLQLLLNFRKETEARSRSHDRTPKPRLHWQAEDIHRPPGASKHAFEPAAHSLRDFDQKPRIVWKAAQIEAPSDAVFEHLFADSPHAYWLDSSLKRETLGGWSFMGDARGPLARIARYDVSTRCIEVSTASRTSVVHVPYLDWLDRDLAEQRTELPPDAPFEFSLGWIGYLGYELKADGFGNAAHRAPYPDACMIFADRAIAFDHSTGFVYVIALEASEAKVPWIEPTLERLKKRPASMRHRQRPALRSRLELRHSKPDYIRMIDQCQRMIRAGETYEVCLTNMLSGTIDGSPLETYLYLRDANPAPFGAFLRFGDLAILSMSPERFLSVNNSGIVESRPIKGTRPRGQSPSEDAAIIAKLQRSPKDRAENLMIVDLVRNDLGRCAEIGTVSVDQI
ncbi:MAG: chorismate-binding protein, partial [Myxococcota bacterium]